MFDLDDFVSDCLQALEEDRPTSAVKEVLARAVSDASAVADALPATKAELTPLYVSDRLTVLKVVWAPGMRIRPHNHLMWAAIGLYGGREDNAYYRRSGETIVASGGRLLDTGDVGVLGADAIHAVTNPTARFTGAIHVYGGDLTSRTGRSEWDDETGAEVAYDFDRTRAFFAEHGTTAG